MDKEINLILLQNTQGEEEWESDWGRNCKNVDEANNFYGELDPGNFYMPFDKYLKLFVGTCLCRDSIHRKDYQFSDIVTNLSKHKDYFYKFSLMEDLELDNDSDLFSIMIDQQGERLQNYHKDGQNDFQAAEFFIGLLRQVSDEGESSYELVSSKFDSHYKLSLNIDGSSSMPAGRYIIVVAPFWNE